jgi:elongation factor G
MGELHLEIVLNRLERDYHVVVNAGKPQVVYRETVSMASEASAVFDREIGGTRHFASVQLHIAPSQRGLGNTVVNKVRDLSVPEMYFASIEQGIQDAFSSGTISGYPVVDVEATVSGGTFQEGVSSELAFRVAASMAFRNAFEQGSPILLEPYMSVEILSPDEFLGEVLGDINMRKGRVESITSRKAIQVITAVVPLSKMFGYSTALRSSSQGRATFTMHFSHYDLASGQ